MHGALAETRKIHGLNTFRIIWLIFMIGSVACRQQDKDLSGISTYRCCHTDCITRDNLTRDEILDRHGNPVKTIVYSYEPPYDAVQTIHYYHKNGKLVQVIDSAEYSIRTILYTYAGDLLSHTRSFVSVWNDSAAAFLPPDTIHHYYRYYNNKLVQEAFTRNGDTTSIINYRYTSDGYYLAQEGSTLRRYSLFENDSISSIEYYPYDEHVKFEDYAFEEDENIWWGFTVSEYEYDSLWRKIKARHVDGPRTISYQHFTYDNHGRLASIRANAYCDTLVYTVPHSLQ